MMMNYLLLENIVNEEFQVEGTLRSEIQLNIKRINGYWLL